MSPTRAGPQAIRVRQPLILAAQLEILAGQRVDGLNLLQAGPEHVHLASPVACESAQVTQLGPNLVEVVIQGDIAAERFGH